ncbi:hypothetical protein [Leptospira interrogans]|uniref:hypothetical protein n=1 Tax=Leptospira interrogans TaxID=173 RepID=UPI00030B01AF
MLGFLGWGGPGACDNGVDSALTAWIPVDLNGDGISDFATLNGNEADGSIHLVGHIQKIGQSAITFNGPNIPIHYNTFYQAVDLNGDGKKRILYMRITVGFGGFIPRVEILRLLYCLEM